MESESVWEQEAAEIAAHVREGNGAQLVQMLYMAQAHAALSAAKLAGAELDVKLAEAVAYNEGKVVGANKESRDASAMGFTAAARRLVIERELEHDLDEALVESCKRAIGLVVAQGGESKLVPELLALRQEKVELVNQLVNLSAKHDALEKVAQEMDAQLSSEQRKEREMSDGF